MGRVVPHVVVALFVLALLPAEAHAQGQPESQGGPRPINPGGVRITVRNPLLGNWDCRAQVCTCKPLACAASSQVRYHTAPSPARKPDPQALERFAKVDVPKQIMAANAAQGVLSDGKDKFEMLGTKVSNHLGYPSVLSETTFTRDKKVVYLATAMIFAGPALVTVTSVSPDRAVAMKSLNDLIRAMSIEEGPPIGPNIRPAPPAAPGRSADLLTRT
jgi:hypothetical protein